jgi:hypothetical protein
MTVPGEQGAGEDDTWPAMESLDVAAEPDLISPAEVLRYLDEREAEDAPGGGGALPGILSMPEGIRVDERRVGRAVAQWILHVRCDCGRRWFEAGPVDTATCPRCGVLVYVDIDARSRRP